MRAHALVEPEQVEPARPNAALQDFGLPALDSPAHARHRASSGGRGAMSLVCLGTRILGAPPIQLLKGTNMPVAVLEVPRPDLAIWGILTLGFIGVCTLVVAGVAGYVAIRTRPGDAERTIHEILHGGVVLRMSAIYGVVMTAGLLAMTGTLNDGAVAILSGIAGYVLGTIRSQQGSRSNHSHEPTSPPGSASTA